MIKIHDMNENKKICLIGATGLVGRELTLLLPSLFTARFASEKKEDQWGPIEPIEKFNPANFDLVVLATPSSVSKKIAEKCALHPCTVIDASSAFRMDPDVDLIIPEINGDSIRSPLIASPNCTTTLMLMALFPLQQLSEILSVHVCSYQAASGGGKKLLDRLINDTKNHFTSPSDSSLAFAVWPHESSLDSDGYCEEENKLIQETHKILQKKIPIHPFCVRTSSLRVHGLAITIEFAAEITPLQAQKQLEAFPGITYIDDPSLTSRYAENKNEVICTKIRQDQFYPNKLQIWLMGDQLRKGAAYNLKQLIELSLSPHLQKTVK